MHHPSISEDLSQMSAAGRFSVGGKAALFPFTFALKNKSVLPYVFIPSLIHIAGYAIAIYFFLQGVSDIKSMMQEIMAGKEFLVGIRALFSANFMSSVMKEMGYILLKIIPSIIFAYAIASPFLDTLSQKVESILLGVENDIPFNVAKLPQIIMQEGIFSILYTSIYISTSLSLLLLGIIPVVGSILGFILSHVFIALYTSLEVINISMSRHELSTKERFISLKEHFYVHFGFGLTAAFLLAVPGLMPFVIIGGTKLFIQLAVYDCIPHSLTKDIINE